MENLQCLLHGVVLREESVKKLQTDEQGTYGRKD